MYLKKEIILVNFCSKNFVFYNCIANLLSCYGWGVFPARLHRSERCVCVCVCNRDTEKGESSVASEQRKAFRKSQEVINQPHSTN